jgi:uncharacterized protein YjbI with pentapeptide repeats
MRSFLIYRIGPFVAFLLFFLIGLMAIEGSSQAIEPLRSVMAKEIIEKIEAGLPIISYDHVIIEGDLVLDQADIPEIRIKLTPDEISHGLHEVCNHLTSIINIKNSTFNGTIKFKDLIFSEPVYLTNNTFKECQVMRSHINKSIYFNNSKFLTVVDIRNDIFEGDANFKGSQFKEGIQIPYSLFNKNVDFSNCIFYGKSSISWTKFSGQVNFNNASFVEDVYFTRNNFNESLFEFAKFYKNASFFLSKFLRLADFRFSEFQEDANFGQTEIADASFDKTSFKNANFEYSDLHNANFEGSKFFHTNFEKATFSKDVDFSDAKFYKLANYNQSIFRGNANFHSASFGEDARFDKAKFYGDTNFEYSDFANNVSLERSQFYQPSADFKRSTFKNYANFQDTRFNGSSDFTGAIFEGKANFAQSHLGEDAIFDDSHFKEINLTRTKYGILYIKLSNIDKLAYNESAYHLLIENFDRIGLHDDANVCYYRFMKDSLFKKPLTENNILNSFCNSILIILELFSYILYGFGTRIDYPIYWSAVVIASFSYLFRKKALSKPGSNWEFVSFSATVFLSGTKLFVDKPDYPVWLKSERLVNRYYCFERILGGLLSILLFFAVSNTMLSVR